MSNKDEERTERQHEEGYSGLRKYSTSWPAFLIFTTYMVFTAAKSSHNYNLAALLILSGLFAFTTYFPVRIRTHFSNNEFFICEYAMTLGIFWVDPFQLGLAAMVGSIISFIAGGMERRHVVANAYSIFITASSAALLLQSPTGSHHWYFFIQVGIGIFLFFICDLISLYLVCKFTIRDVVELFYCGTRGVTFGICIFLGIPTCILIESRPGYAIYAVGAFIATCILVNKYNYAIIQREQHEAIISFITATANEESQQHKQALVLEMTKSAVKHDNVNIRSTKPGKNEFGGLLYSDEDGEHWLVIKSSTIAGKNRARDMKMIDDITIVARKAFEHQELQNKLYEAAHHDALTGVLNRRTFEEFVNHDLGLVRRSKMEFSLMFIDIDGFKPVNDTYGHEAGDDILKSIAHRLTSVVRTQDVVARLGGDEFVVLCRELNIEDAERLAVRIIESLVRPFDITQHLEHKGEIVEIQVGASIGIAGAPSDGTDFESLLRVADSRMYRAKKSHKHIRIVMDDAGKKTRIKVNPEEAKSA